METTLGRTAVPTHQNGSAFLSGTIILDASNSRPCRLQQRLLPQHQHHQLRLRHLPLRSRPLYQLVHHTMPCVSILPICIKWLSRSNMFHRRRFNMDWSLLLPGQLYLCGLESILFPVFMRGKQWNQITSPPSSLALFRLIA
jgi:hypothetical protein